MWVNIVATVYLMLLYVILKLAFSVFVLVLATPLGTPKH